MTKNSYTMANLQEIFLPIKGFEGYYEISNMGRVKSLKRTIHKSNGKIQTVRERILKHGLGTNGYRFVNCRLNNKSYFLYLHRIVSIHFINNPESKDQVNHKDGDKLNNCSSNLEWATQSENITHAYKYGLQGNRAGINNPNYKHGRDIIYHLI